MDTQYWIKYTHCSVRLKWDLSVAWPIKRMNFIFSVTIVIFYRGGHNVLPFLHCHCPHLIPPSAKSKSISVKRELTFLEAYKWVEQEGSSSPGTLTDTVTAPGENIPFGRQGSRQDVIWNLQILRLASVPALCLSGVKEKDGAKMFRRHSLHNAAPLPVCKQILSFINN